MLRHVYGLAVTFVFLASQARTQTCTGIAGDLFLPGADGIVRCSAVHDDGSGSALYVGGRFMTIGGMLSPGIARWNGTSWTAIASDIEPGSPNTPDVEALLSFNGRLYAGGTFDLNGVLNQVHLIVWNGTQWSAVPGGPDGSVTALAAYHGSLLVGGPFVNAGFSPCNRVARYEPSTFHWSAFGGGFFDGVPRCFATYVEPTGEHLFIGGETMVLSPGNANPIYRWDGTAWSIPSGGVTGGLGLPSVTSMIVHDDGAGPELWVGGLFNYAGGTPAQDLARWNGSTWSPVGVLGMDFDCHCGPTVSALLEHDDGSGPAVFAAGTFTSADGIVSPNLIRWRGGAFHATAKAPDTGAWTLNRFHGELIVGGTFGYLGGLRASRLGTWNGTSWKALSDGAGAEGSPSVMCLHDDGSGPKPYGWFRSLGQSYDNSPAMLRRWEHGAWTDVPQPPANAALIAMVSANIGGGQALFAGGQFGNSDPSAFFVGVPFSGVERLDSNGWTPLGNTSIAGGLVRSLAVFDEGAGPRLFAGGTFNAIDGIVAHGIARWNGTTWSDVATSINSPSGGVSASCVYDDGNGPALYIGGAFSQVGGVAIDNVARWNGNVWSAVGSGLPWAPETLVVHDDGTGPTLYAAGTTAGVGFNVILHVAWLRNGVWIPIDAGLVGQSIHALQSFDDGSGPALYATGNFVAYGSPTGIGIARWKGLGWEGIGMGLGNPPIESGSQTAIEGRSMLARVDGSHAELWIGGSFGTLNGVVSNSTARLCSELIAGTPFCSGDGSAASCPCGNDAPPGSQSGCLNSLGLGGSLSATGYAHLFNDTVELNGNGMPDSFALYFQGTTQLVGGMGSPFVDGLRCAGGSIIRLGVTLNAAGASRFPDGPSQRVSVKGNVIVPGIRTYQTWYRNAAAYCTPWTVNTTNGVTITWTP